MPPPDAAPASFPESVVVMPVTQPAPPVQPTEPKPVVMMTTLLPPALTAKAVHTANKTVLPNGAKKANSDLQKKLIPAAAVALLVGSGAFWLMKQNNSIPDIATGTPARAIPEIAPSTGGMSTASEAATSATPVTPVTINPLVESTSPTPARAPTNRPELVQPTTVAIPPTQAPATELIEKPLQPSIEQSKTTPKFERPALIDESQIQQRKVDKAKLDKVNKTLDDFLK
jgi:4-amino-4-deoxy-L-arabinose transferase-like glycosyltransferase